MTTKVMWKEKTDQVLQQVSLEMTPERRERFMRATRELLPMIQHLIESPAEAIAVLQIMIDAIMRSCGRSYEGIVLVQDRVVPESTCYGCGAKTNRAGEPEGHTPESGDLSICAYCGALSVFDDDLKAVQPSEAQMKESMAVPHIAAMVEATKAAIAKRKESA